LKLNPDFSKEHAGENSCNFALPNSLAMEVGEWSFSGSGRFIPDVTCTEVCVSLDAINY